ALLLAGTVRAEATLALANLIYLVLLGVGGVIFPLTKFPAGAQGVLTLLPSGALSDGLRSVLQHGAGAPVRDLAVLVVWAAVAIPPPARPSRGEYTPAAPAGARPARPTRPGKPHPDPAPRPPPHPRPGRRSRCSGPCRRPCSSSPGSSRC